MNRIRLTISILCLLAAMAFGGGITLRVAKADIEPVGGTGPACNCNGDRGLRCDCQSGSTTDSGHCCCNYSCSIIA